MIEAIYAFIGKTLASFAKPSGDYLKDKFSRPTLKLKKAPTNIFEHIKPAASKEYVRETLGPAHQIVGNSWFYHFSDALIQIEYWQDNGAKSIALGLTGKGKKSRFSIPVCSKPLGQLSIEDVRMEDDSLRFRSSLRHQDIIVEIRLGPTGAWSNWTFGATMAVGAQNLLESFFEWDSVESRLQTAPSMVLINWVAISDSQDEVYFDWSFS